jgi:uncharacterized phage-like protein YoqJ
MIAELEKKFNHIQKLLDTGVISEKEYAVLISNLGLEQAIATNAKDLQKKNGLYDAMIKAVAVAKMIS